MMIGETVNVTWTVLCSSLASIQAITDVAEVGGAAASLLHVSSYEDCMVLSAPMTVEVTLEEVVHITNPILLSSGDNVPVFITRGISGEVEVYILLTGDPRQPEGDLL